MKNCLKKTQTLVLAIIMTLVLISNTAFAETVSGVDVDSLGSNKDDYLIEYTEVGIVGISGYVGQQCDILLPDMIHEDEVDLPVEFISYDAFASNNLIENVIIPDGVINIFDGAFQGCSMLKTVVIPESVQYIGTDAFRGCENLVHVELPSHLSYAGAGIFEGCNKLELTQKQLDTLTYTDDAAFQAEQAAFVTDTENLIDVSVYLGVNVDDVSSVIDGMPEFIWSERSDGIYSSNSWIGLSSLSCEYVDSVELFAKSNYAFDGVYVGMADTDAIKALLRAGWKLDKKWDIGSSFEKENGDVLSFWVDEKRIITNIVLNLSEQGFETDDLESEPSEESITDSNPVNEAYAYTTGDVNLRSGPGLGYQSLCVIPNGTRLLWLQKEEVDERGVAWYYISYDGVLGWGSSKYVYVED